MQKTMTKRLRVFAGPNGSGKSTLFEEFSKKYHILACDKSYLFDNSGETLTLLAEKKDESFLILHVDLKKLPNWFNKYVLNHYL